MKVLLNNIKKISWLIDFQQSCANIIFIHGYFLSKRDSLIYSNKIWLKL